MLDAELRSLRANQFHANLMRQEICQHILSRENDAISFQFGATGSATDQQIQPQCEDGDWEFAFWPLPKVCWSEIAGPFSQERVGSFQFACFQFVPLSVVRPVKSNIPAAILWIVFYLHVCLCSKFCFPSGLKYKFGF